VLASIVMPNPISNATASSKKRTERLAMIGEVKG